MKVRIELKKINKISMTKSQQTIEGNRQANITYKGTKCFYYQHNQSMGAAVASTKARELYKYLRRYSTQQYLLLSTGILDKGKRSTS